MPFPESKFAQVMPSKAHGVLVRLAIESLDDDEGISDDAYQTMRELFTLLGVDAERVWRKVKANDNRWYLPEGWNMEVPF